MNIFTALVLLLLVAGTTSIVNAQTPHREYDQWHFGAGGIYPTTWPASYGCLNTLEGCAVYRASLYNPSDSTSWMIITDGLTVYDQHCRIAFNGSGLMGHPSSTQSALITPRPGDLSVFYIFTAGAGPYVNDHNNGIRFSKVSVYNNQFLQVTDKNTVLLDTATEKLVGVGHCNDRDYWVLAHGWGNNNFYAWLVTDTGVVRQPVVSSVGAVHEIGSPEYTIGYMKASPNGKRLVVVCNSMRTVQLFDFDNSTGVVSNPIDLPSVGSNYSGEYGASFSPDNTRLYITGIDSTLWSTLYQYTVTGTPAEIVASRELIFSAPIAGNPTNQLAALQLYHDVREDTIYTVIVCARAESSVLGTILNPNAPGDECRYEHDGTTTVSGESSFGLPNNIDKHYNTGASCYRPRAFFPPVAKNICVGQCTGFRDHSSHRPTSWKWLFPGGEPAMSTQQHPRNICYDQPGVYSVTLIVGNERGSDTIVFPGAVVVWSPPQADAGPDTTICAGSEVVLQGRGGGSYLWSPDYRLSSRRVATPVARPLKTTTYIVKVESGPCIGYDTVVVTVLDPPGISAVRYDLCAGDSLRHFYPASGSYHWEPATGLSDPDSHEPWIVVDKSIRYTVTLTDSNGCSASAFFDVVVHPAPRVDAGGDIVLCSGAKARLQATASESGGTYLWSPPHGLDRPDRPNPIVNPQKTTRYIVTFTTDAGCRTVDTVNVVVVPLPQVDAGPDMVSCSGSEVELRATGPPGTYSWTPTAGLSNPKQPVTSARPATTTMYRVMLTDANGCTAVDSVLVTVHTPVVQAGADVASCKGEPVRLRATGGDGTYAWTPTEGLDDPTGKSPLASPLETTVYTVTLTDKYGCTAVDNVVVVVSTTGTVDAGEDRTICAGGAVQLNSSGITGVYSWTPADGLSDPAIDNPIATPATTTVYRLYVKSPGGCEAIDSVVVTVLPRPQVDAGTDVAICRNGSTQLRATGDPGRYYWQPETGLDNPASPSPTASPDATTMYRVTLIADNGCTQTDSVAVFVADTLTVDAGPDRVICAGDSVRLAVAAAEGTVVWTPAEGLDDPTHPAPMASPAATTKYRVSIVSASGCSGSDEVTVTVVPPPVVDAGGDVVVCRGGRTILAATGSGGTVLWTPAEGLDDPTSRTPVASPQSTTLYRIVLTAGEGCRAEDSVRVVVADPPVVVAGADTTVCAGAPVVLTAVAGSGVYRWEPASTVDNPAGATTIARPTASTVYTVQYTDGMGCAAVDSVAVVVSDNTAIAVVLPHMTATVGDLNFRLPVSVRSTGGITGPVSLAFTIRYREKVLKFTGIDRGTLREYYQGEPGVLAVRIDNVTVPPGETVVAQLAAVPLIASVQYTDLEIEADTNVYEPCIVLQKINGSVTVDGICIGSGLRFLVRPDIVAGPNPATDILYLRVSPSGEGEPSIEVHTLWGTTVQVPFREESAGEGKREFLCDVSSLASGTYSLVVRLAGAQYVYPLCIVK